MEQFITETFSQYAYAPMWVYGAICVFMLMSAFGLPIPEEVVLISAGFIGFMSLHPQLFPPPYPGAQSVNVYTLATVAFFAVMGADYLIYQIGKSAGPKLFKMAWFTKIVSPPALHRAQAWMGKYGPWTVFIFRFTPGVRFPGHLICGAMGIPAWKFIAVDALAAGISVPTQVLLVSFYGKYILQYFTRFKIVLGSAIAIAIVAYIVYRITQRRRVRV